MGRISKKIPQFDSCLSQIKQSPLFKQTKNTWSSFLHYRTNPTFSAVFPSVFYFLGPSWCILPHNVLGEPLTAKIRAFITFLFAVIKYQTNYRRGLFGLMVPEGWKFVMVGQPGSKQQTWQLEQSWALTSWTTSRKQRERTRSNRVFKLSNPTSGDIVPSSKPYLLKPHNSATNWRSSIQMTKIIGHLIQLTIIQNVIFTYIGVF